MKRRLKRISPLSAAKMLGALYACLGLLILPFFTLGGLAGAFASHANHTQNLPGSAPALMGGFMLIIGLCAPLFYGALGFIGGLLMAALYNLFAGWIGGIEIEME